MVPPCYHVNERDHGAVFPEAPSPSIRAEVCFTPTMFGCEAVEADIREDGKWERVDLNTDGGCAAANRARTVVCW